MTLFHSRYYCVLCLIVGLATGLRIYAEEDQKVLGQDIYFRDIGEYKKIKIIGNFGLPIGQSIILEGERPNKSKVTNEYTLEVKKINGKQVEKKEKLIWPPYIQIRNVESLPEGETIILKGYELLVWVGAPQKNWHVDVAFEVTEVITPKKLKITVLDPYR
jgi:hypothetical protein